MEPAAYRSAASFSTDAYQSARIPFMAMDLGDRMAQAYAQNLSTLAAGAGNPVAALSEAVALRRPLGVLPAGPGG